ncbi:hypothetical protein X760_13000 [Mesorhizobium sp. LSHC422A00]|nr:hypothetical protein X760_13000 [Mesorhizobium sp. LSHC422A00]
MSSGCPTRPTGRRLAIASSVSCFLSPATKLQIGVSTQPRRDGVDADRRQLDR